jgi:riboflavin kinase
VASPFPQQPPTNRRPTAEQPPNNRQELGIPTANVDAASLRAELAEAVTGIYCGFASIGASKEVHKMVMSIGARITITKRPAAALPCVCWRHPYP